MNLSTCKKLLKKATALLDTEDGSSSELSALEIALLRSYLVEAYDATLSNQAAAAPVTTARATANSEAPIAQQKTQTAAHTPKPTPAPVSVVSPSIQAPEASATVVATSTTMTKPSVNKNIRTLLEAHREQIKSGHHAGRGIADLNKAIGINDRLLFVRHLFSGDQAELMAANTKLNTLTSVEDILHCLSELADQHGWDHPEKQDAVSSYLYLVARKTA